MELPIMDCPNCRHRGCQEEWSQGGYCYKFQAKPKGNTCAEFEQRRVDREASEG